MTPGFHKHIYTTLTTRSTGDNGMKAGGHHLYSKHNTIAFMVQSSGKFDLAVMSSFSYNKNQHNCQRRTLQCCVSLVVIVVQGI